MDPVCSKRTHRKVVGERRKVLQVVKHQVAQNCDTAVSQLKNGWRLGIGDGCVGTEWRIDGRAVESAMSLLKARGVSPEQQAEVHVAAP